MPWRRFSSPQAGIEIEADVNNQTGAVGAVRAINSGPDFRFVRVYDQADNLTTFVAEFPAGSTRNNSAQVVPSGIFTIKQAINEDTGQPIPGAFYWDNGLEIGVVPPANVDAWRASIQWKPGYPL
jgi:hypothetical protein